MKKFALLLALVAATQAQACSVSNSTASTEVREAISKNGWDFKNYDEICSKLLKANVELLISGDATVLQNRSIAWASVSLKDKDLPVATNSYGGLSTQINEYAGMDKAKEMLMVAINNAVNSMNVDKAIQELNEARQKARAAYTRKAK